MFGTIKDYSEASISDCITYQVKTALGNVALFLEFIQGISVELV